MVTRRGVSGQRGPAPFPRRGSCDYSTCRALRGGTLGLMATDRDPRHASRFCDPRAVQDLRDNRREYVRRVPVRLVVIGSAWPAASCKARRLRQHPG
jgi:hypothetical protein